MKKYLILLLAAAAALVSCGKEILDPEDGDVTVQTAPITFNLTANHPDATKAVKTGWESGDAIFVFFTGAAAPRHLKMTFDGSSWTSAEYNGATQTAGALGLTNGMSGTMRAVFLPFGNDATVVADGTGFKFSTDYYTYYATATLDYTVTNNTVSGAFDMTIPDDYVQFFIEDAAATDGAYTLATDAVKPFGIASIGSYGTIIEQHGSAGDPMTGYAYSGGYLFSGKLNPFYDYSGSYYFAKTKTANGSRADYFVTGKTLASHSAVKLPANDNVYALQYGTPNKGKWIPVGEGITVKIGAFTGSGSTEMFGSYGTWQTCNYGATAPEGIGTKTDFTNANATLTLPTQAQYETIVNHCTWTTVSVRGQVGKVVHSNAGFLFFPMWWDGEYRVGQFWTSTAYGDDRAYYLELYGLPHLDHASKTGWAAVRAFVN